MYLQEPWLFRPIHWIQGIPNLQLYLDSRFSLYQDSALTTPATAVNDPVGGWKDLSGNGNHFTQATSGKRGVIKSGIFANGDPAIYFDRSALATLTSSYQLSDGSGVYLCTMIVKYKLKTAASGTYSDLLTVNLLQNARLHSISIVNSVAGYMPYDLQGNQGASGSFVGWGTINTNADTTSEHTFVFQWLSPNTDLPASYHAYFDGVLQTLATQTGGGLTQAQPTTLNGNTGDNSSIGDCYYSKIAVFNRVLTATEVAAVLLSMNA